MMCPAVALMPTAYGPACGGAYEANTQQGLEPCLQQQSSPTGVAFPGLAFSKLRSRAMYAPGHGECWDQPHAGHPDAVTQHSSSNYSAAHSAGLACEQYTHQMAGGSSDSPRSRFAVRDSLTQWDSVSTVGLSADGSSACAEASTAATPSAGAGSSATTSACSTPSSHKRTSTAKWLHNFLKPKAKASGKQHMQAVQEAQSAQQLFYQHLQPHDGLTLQEQEALQLQLQLEEQEELAFQQQSHAHGWDQLPEHLQQQLKKQFHQEFMLQLQQQQEEEEELQAYPAGLGPTMQPQQQQQMYGQEQAMQELQQHVAAGEASTFEQHLQHQLLQQQLEIGQLQPEDVQWMLQQHVQQQQAQQAQTQGQGVHSHHGCADDTAGAAEEEGADAAAVHVLGGADNQVVQVTTDEFQDILTVMQALAGVFCLLPLKCVLWHEFCYCSSHQSCCFEHHKGVDYASCTVHISCVH